MWWGRTVFLWFRDGCCAGDGEGIRNVPQKGIFTLGTQKGKSIGREPEIRRGYRKWKRNPVLGDELSWSGILSTS